LADKFRAEYPAILTWLIQGYDLYQKHGLVPPQAVVDATKGYFTEQDIFKLFVEEYYVADANGKIYAKNVYQDYCNWCDYNGEKPVSNIIFSKELQRLGINRTKDRNGIVYGLMPRECETT
ncbi:MAG: hypothetical protein J6A39_03030, partial [Peptococcaceae bacterium]|nr:hypothetical protein [Peptococcaceae bacterium]